MPLLLTFLFSVTLLVCNVYFLQILFGVSVLLAVTSRESLISYISEDLYSTDNILWFIGVLK